ncbi:MAG: GNAT family N-acetyltransferase [Erysipelotrichaceae bacterium]|nr:GNAT family N-acetyltransferase [Erysipelotrichaceae bacterium]
MEKIDQPHMPDEYELIAAEPSEIAAHIRECYREETVTDEELLTYTQRSVYDKDLWIAIREKQTGKIIASGIGEFDETIGEGILEWIQVSPKYRRKGLGKVIVCELLKRLSEKAGFVTVSGRMNNPDDPFSLYKACGFEDPVIWHIVR